MASINYAFKIEISKQEQKKINNESQDFPGFYCLYIEATQMNETRGQYNAQKKYKIKWKYKRGKWKKRKVGTIFYRIFNYKVEQIFVSLFCSENSHIFYI